MSLKSHEIRLKKFKSADEDWWNGSRGVIREQKDIKKEVKEDLVISFRNEVPNSAMEWNWNWNGDSLLERERKKKARIPCVTQEIL